MADFSQLGSVATLHAVVGRPLADLEAEVARHARVRPVRLVIPALASELDGPALPAIIDRLAEVAHLAEVVIGLDGADRSDFDRARRLVGRLGVPHRVLWHDGPELSSVATTLAAEGIATAPRGKGRNLWWCLGYLAGGDGDGVIAMHDADITTYSREMLARLVYPVVHPEFGYTVAKGYYARVGGGRFNGRVARLLVAPLLRSIRIHGGASSLLDFLESFRYPLAGECALDAAVASSLPIPASWGLEVGLLAEIHDRCDHRSVCQVDLGDAYDHKHQHLSADDAGAGLHRMAIEVAEMLQRRMPIRDQECGSGAATFVTTFERIAHELAVVYRHDAVMNGLVTDPVDDERLVAVFAGSVAAARGRLDAGDGATPMLPAWDDVLVSVPDAATAVRDAADRDHASSP